MIYLFKIVIFHTLLNYRRVFCTVIYPISADDQEGMNEQPMISVLPTNLSGTGMLSPFAEGMVGTAFHWSIVQAPPTEVTIPFCPASDVGAVLNLCKGNAHRLASGIQHRTARIARIDGCVHLVLWLIYFSLYLLIWLSIHEYVYIYIRIYNYTYIYIPT